MKVLTSDLELIAQSMRDLSRETNEYYLEKGSGKLFVISRVLIRSLVEGYGEVRAPLPEWDMQMIPLAREIVLMGSSSFVRVPEAFGRPEHIWMMEFTKEVRLYKLRQKLVLALRGRGSCQRFKEILKAHPVEAKSWSEHCQRKWRERVQRWLEGLGILAINESSTRLRSAA